MSLATFSPHATKGCPDNSHNANNVNRSFSNSNDSSTNNTAPTATTLDYVHNNNNNQYYHPSSSIDEDYSSQQYTLPTIGQFYFLHGSPPPPPPSLRKEWQHLYVLPVLLLEFLAIALTRAVLPGILLEAYGRRVYLVLGVADCIRGILAFWACPLFGKLSDDIWGRKSCLLVTVLGSCAPVCSLAFFSWKTVVAGTTGGDTFESSSSMSAGGGGEDLYEPQELELTTSPATSELSYSLPPMAIPLFVVLLSLSGIFSSTFTLVFAYISDTVKTREDRVGAYGLALATFGLSFTIGPMAGGYLAKYDTHNVFVCSLLLTILDLLYIYFILPESRSIEERERSSRRRRGRNNNTTTSLYDDGTTTSTANDNASTSQMLWSTWDASIQMIVQDPFLKKVGQVAFFYYTGLWAVISTLSLYAVQHFHLTPERLGELMSALGLSTMVAEAVLVRLLVPMMGEKRATRLGLLSFALQCVVLGFATEGWHLFVCVAFSLLGNLVYPSLSSLVSSTVEPDSVGEALGAMNGIKSLTEGIGPLFFGALMTVSEDSAFPGWPYWIAALFVLVAHHMAASLPDGDHDDGYYMYKYGGGGGGGGASGSKSSSPRHDDDYVHELEFKWRRGQPGENNNKNSSSSNRGGLLSNIPLFGGTRTAKSTSSSGGGPARRWYDTSNLFATPTRDDTDEEYEGLLALSEVEEMDEDDEDQYQGADSHRTPPRSRRVDIHLPISPLFNSSSPRRIPPTAATPNNNNNNNNNKANTPGGISTLGSSMYHGDDEEEGEGYAL